TTKTEGPATAAADDDGETAAAVEVTPAGPLSEEPAAAADSGTTAERPDEAGVAEGSLCDAGGVTGESLCGVKAAGAEEAAVAGSPSELFAELDSSTGARAM
ncbi:unnamed protein product, partial [Ectocarpus fasciculatus]